MAEDGRPRDDLPRETAELRREVGALGAQSPVRQRAEAELQDYEKCYPWIFENIHDVFYRTDMEAVGAVARELLRLSRAA